MKQVHSKVTIRVTSGPSADGDLRENNDDNSAATTVL